MDETELRLLAAAIFVFKWLALLGIPLAGAAVAWSWRRNRAVLIVLSASESLTVLVELCWYGGLQTSSTAANINICIAACVAWCVLALLCWSACWLLRPRILGIVARGLATLALLPYFTVGVFLAWVEVDERSAPPLEETEIRPGLSCRIEGWGMFAQDGYSVYLYRRWAAFPALRRVVAQASRSLNENPASCESVAAASGY